VRLLVVGWILLSSVTGGLTAREMHPGARESSTWSVAARCTIVGVFFGVATFLFVYAMLLAAALILLPGSSSGSS
jgi:hypothetical protein